MYNFTHLRRIALGFTTRQPAIPEPALAIGFAETLQGVPVLLQRDIMLQETKRRLPTLDLNDSKVYGHSYKGSGAMFTVDAFPLENYLGEGV